MQFLAALSLFLSPAVAPAGLLESDTPLDRALASAQARLESTATLVGDHSTWENAWELETEHYRVRTTANWYIGKRMGKNLEVMFGFFQEITGSDWEPSQPLSIFLFEDLADYNQFGTDNGEYHSSILGSYYASGHADQPVATYVHHSPKQLAMWVTHSAFHQFAGGAFSQPAPTWFEEGLASYFANAYWDQDYLASEFKRISRGSSYVPLGTLLREPIDQYVADPHSRFIELGMLFNYLLHKRPDTMTQKNADGIVLLAPAADYVSGTMRGLDVSDNPVHELLTVDLEQLEAELRDFQF